MTSAAGKGEAIHSPGPLSSGIIADIGWKYMYIRYQPLKDVEEILKPLEFKVSVDSDLGLKKKSLYLIYSKDNFKSPGDSILFGQPDSAGYYTASLSATEGSGKIYYYISARDTVSRIFTSPVQAPGSSYNLNIGPDTIKPVITHVPASYVLSSVNEIEINATVTDNIGVDTVKVIFSTSGKEQVTAGLNRGENDVFSGKFHLSDMGLKNGDSIKYSFVAVDMAKRKNTGYLPASGKFSVIVEGIFKPVTGYVTDFNTTNNDFILTDFKINKESGFDNAALNSPHPYLSPDKDNSSLDYTTVLRYPVIITATGRMSFDEVVLVEPGETGAVFGGSEFWDYVIIEGSKDFGNTWLPFLDGYDSGSQTSWKTAYNQSFSGDNSTATGSKDLYINRDFILTGNNNFKAGDTVLIRFRLYSDPYAHGWGWAIDNLKIQQNTTAVSLSAISPGKIMIWPNPAENSINLMIEHEEIIKHLDVVIYDMTGRTLLKEYYINVLPGSVTRLNLDNVPEGLFFVAVKIDGIPVQVRKMVKR
jgi:Secretion system C-terminal sorting domain